MRWDSFPIFLRAQQREIHFRDTKRSHLVPGRGRAFGIGLGKRMAEMTATGGGMSLDDADARHVRKLGSRLLFLTGRLARFEAGDVGEEGIDLSGFKRESRHRRVTDDNAFSQRLLKGLDRIPL